MNAGFEPITTQNRHYLFIVSLYDNNSLIVFNFVLYLKKLFKIYQIHS